MNFTKYTNRKHLSEKLLGLSMAVLLLSSFGFGMFWSNASQVQAQTSDTYTLLEPLPCIPSPATVDGNGNTVPAVECPQSQITEVDFQGYVQYMFNLLIALAAVTAVFMIVWGGFEYMSSDSLQKKNDGLNKLKNAVSGLLLVLCSYLILKTIDPRLVAIPVNLVEPIKIMCASNKSILVTDPKCVEGNMSSFFKQLATDAESYKIQNKEIVNAILTTRTLVTNVEKKIEEIKKQLATAEGAGDTAKIRSLNVDLAKAMNEKKEAESIIRVEYDKSRIVSATSINLTYNNEINATTNNLAVIDTAQKLATESYGSALAELNQRGNSANEITNLKNLYWPIKGSLELQRIELDKTSKDSAQTKIDKINQILSSSIPNITDQTKKVALEKQATELINNLKKRADAEKSAGIQDMSWY